MKEPKGDLLQLSFYLPNQTPEIALNMLVKALLECGANFSGIARGCTLNMEESGYFIPKARIYREKQLHVSNFQELQSWLDSEEIRVLEVLMTNASDTTKDECVIVTYGSISDQAARHDTPTVSVLSMGDIFSLARLPISDSKKYAIKAKQAGKRTYIRLKSIIEIINPAYGSITIEWPLEVPADLKNDPRSLAFRDFYISESFMGANTVTLLRNLFKGAYIEEMSHGLYISCTREFNPEGIEVDKKVSPWNTLSTQVGKIIANAA
ncbi:MAG: hypothetical protein AAF702_29050 [Chloroflexota bacterium]